MMPLGLKSFRQRFGLKHFVGIFYTGIETLRLDAGGQIVDTETSSCFFSVSLCPQKQGADGILYKIFNTVRQAMKPRKNKANENAEEIAALAENTLLTRRQRVRVLFSNDHKLHVHHHQPLLSLKTLTPVAKKRVMDHVADHMRMMATLD